MGYTTVKMGSILLKILITVAFPFVMSDTEEMVGGLMVLHRCNNIQHDIEILCPSGFIHVESAIIGTSKGWTGGLNICPRNDETCIQEIKLDNCSMTSICYILPETIAQDLHNGCALTNYIQINYTCVSEPPIDQTTVLILDSSTTFDDAKFTTTDGQIYPESESSTAVCQKECVIGISLGLVAMIAGSLCGVFLYKRFHQKEADSSNAAIPQYSQSFGTSIVENTNYTSNDNSSVVPQNIKPSVSAKNPQLFSNPDYWDGDIMITTPSNNINPSNLELTDDYSEIPANITKNSSEIDDVYLDIEESTLDKDSGLENEYFEVGDESHSSHYSDNEYSEIEESRTSMEGRQLPNGYEVVELGLDNFNMDNPEKLAENVSTGDCHIDDHSDCDDMDHPGDSQEEKIGNTE